MIKAWDEDSYEEQVVDDLPEDIDPSVDDSVPEEDSEYDDYGMPVEAPETDVEESEEEVEPEVSEAEESSTTSDSVDEERLFFEEDPPEFESYKKKASWYEEKYKEVVKTLKDPQLKSQLADSYAQEMLQAQEKADRAIAVYKALEKDPEVLVKTYFGDQLKKVGYDVSLTKAEMQTAVNHYMAEEFGDNYKDMFDPAEVLDPTSQSHKMYNRMNELAVAMQQQNNTPAKAEPKDVWTDPTIAQRIEQDYEQHFKPANISKARYDEFINEAKGFLPKMSFHDLHKAMYFSDYMKFAKQQGFEEGKKSVVKNIQKVGEKVEARPKEQEPRKRALSDDDIFNMHRADMNYSHFRRS